MATRPLYGTPANAPVWSKYAVLVGALTATIPTGFAAWTLNDPAATPTPITDQWDPVGMLDTDNPFDSGTETITSTPHSAAGIGIYAMSHRDQQEVIAFTAKQTDLVTLGIVYDPGGLTITSGNIAGTLKQRDPSKQYLFGFQRESANLLERYITKLPSIIDTIVRNNGNDETTYTVSVLITPDTSVTGQPDYYRFYHGAKS